VDWLEQAYYRWDQPPVGGEVDPSVYSVDLRSNPSPEDEAEGAPAAPEQNTGPRIGVPAPMPSPVAKRFPGEGEWTQIGAGADGTAPVYVTRVRPNARNTSLVVFVARTVPALTTLKLFPGIDVPGGEWKTPHQVPKQDCSRLLMAFNGGFRMEGSRGGYYAEKKAAYPLVDGAASLVFFEDGSATVAQWGRDLGPSDLNRIEAVRQNLELLVDNGEPIPDLDQKNWGALLKNHLHVWRSGYGVTSDGAIVYVGGPGLTARDLASTLVNAGVVRGMEGDINPEWVSANLYKVNKSTGRCEGRRGLDMEKDKGGMKRAGNRYLAPDTRDFVAVLRRS